MSSQNDISANLKKYENLNNYSEWMFHTYSNYVGKRIFDVGAGIGRMVSYYIDQAEMVVATDIFQNQIDYMNNRFEKYEYFKAELIDILESDLSPYESRFDTVICINVLEHLSDDFQAVNKMKSLLEPDGNLIILVPAFQKLYCDFDKNVGHYRRYEPGRLREIANENGLCVVKNHYFNMMGMIPYWLKGRIKKGKDESFSSSLNENNSSIYNFASKIMEPIERIIRPRFGLTEVMIMKKSI